MDLSRRARRARLHVDELGVFAGFLLGGEDFVEAQNMIKYEQWARLATADRAFPCGVDNYWTIGRSKSTG